MFCKRSTLAAGVVLSLASGALAQLPPWELIKPSNTGIPGNTITFAKFAPDGRLWVGAWWTFYDEGGVTVYDRAADTWTVYADLGTAYPELESPLPSPFVFDVEFAADGSVWMATGNGLVHKDGDVWTVYDASNSPLLHNIIRNIALDSQGNVWVNNTDVAHAGNAVFRFDGTTWTRYSVPTEIPFPAPWDALYDIAVTANDHVLVTNLAVRGVAEFDGASWTLHGGSLRVFRDIIPDTAGDAWVVTDGGYELYKLHAGTLTLWGGGSRPPGNAISAMAVDDDGTLWIGSFDGVMSRSSDDGQTWSIFGQEIGSILDLAPDNQSGDLFYVRGSNVGHLDATGQWVEGFNARNVSLTNFDIEDISFDTQGNAWFATFGGGICAYDGQRFRGFNPDNLGSEPWPFATDAGYAVLGASDGSVWIGLELYGVARWTGEQWEIPDPNLGAECLAEGPPGMIWMGGGWGVARWDGTSTEMLSDIGMVISDPNSYPNGGREIAPDGTGGAWVAASFGLWYYDDSASQWTGYTTLNSGIPSDYLTSVALAPDGGVWAGSIDGLIHFDGSNWTLYTADNSPLPATRVYAVAVRDDGLLAVGCFTGGIFGGGVALFDGTDWTVFTSDNSPLQHEQIKDLAFDPAGNLWVSSATEGLSVIYIGDNAIPGDLDGDGDVDLTDLATLLNDFGCTSNCTADIDGDGDTDLTDLSLLLANFGS